MPKLIPVFLAIALVSTTGHAELTQNDLKKRRELRLALEEEILDLYSIPFETYVKYEMYDEIGFIFKANNTESSYRLPGKYYSRPYIVNNNVWIFQNAAGGDIHTFYPDNLEFDKKTGNEQFSKYEGGVRLVVDSVTVVSAGSDTDVDAAVIWDTDTDETEIVRLKEGHYVCSAKVDNGVLYLGSCGGLVNAWEYDNLEFSGNFSTSDKTNANWRIFNEKECINGIGVFRDNLVGVGEKSVFVWNIRTRRLKKTWPKTMANSNVRFFDGRIIEFKNSRFAVVNAENGKIVNEASTELDIGDLIVTSEKILSGFKGPFLVLTLRNNNGVRIYDFRTLELLKNLDIRGETLCACKNSIFAADDNNIYKYNVDNRNSRAYGEFLKRIEPKNLLFNAEAYGRLVKLMGRYPEAMAKTGIGDRFLQLNRLTVSHSVKYGKMDADENGDVFGYRFLYDVRNDSDRYYFVSLVSTWDSGHRDETVRFFVEPDGTARGRINLGAEESPAVYFYPEKVDIVSKKYYTNFMAVLEGDIEDAESVDEFLADERLKDWHDTLKQRKLELMNEKGICFLDSLQ